MIKENETLEIEDTKGDPEEEGQQNLTDTSFPLHIVFFIEIRNSHQIRF